LTNRIKRIGRRWSDEGLLKWLMIAFMDVYKQALWDELWKRYLEIHNLLSFLKLGTSYAWI